MTSQSVTVSVNIDPTAVVKKTITNGGGNNRIYEEFLPIGEALV